ncbi:MAG: hypothetical protein HY961_16955 [Ignavibacteriae bacterium]|nr:hypothetical protein [Ignavibacteriota bacterium]
MAFRPAPNLIEGVLDNSVPGRVSGWIDFYREGKDPRHCVLNLDGDFHDDIRGRILHIWNEHPSDAGVDGSLGRIEAGFIDHMNARQKGKVGDITLKHAQGYAYVEWYSERNGRVVMEIPPSQCEVLGPEVDLATLPPRTSHPDIFQSYLRELAVALRKQTKNPNATVLGVGPKGIRTPDEPERN